MTDQDYDGSEPLGNARHERFAQNIAKGMAAGPAYTAAGYKATGNSAKSAGGRLLTNVDVQARIAWLQGSAADQITTIRDLARQHTKAAIETLVSVMEDTKAPAGARIAAATALLDRGWGRPIQHIEAEVNFIDQLTDAEQRTVLGILDRIAADEASDDDDNATRH